MTPLDKAIKRLAQLQREADELRRFIEMYHTLDRDADLSSGICVEDTQLKGNRSCRWE